ncbi:hypothetical protein KEF29_14930 [Streptomyces tuirus]|uniref:Uncharacterized protein n=1 Tax=Streptomyces tuirus TaxID=68278 RepID=A0A941J5N6_9ACTN|nr:hypothetical protein [Streptomyces tuirus]
MTNFLPRPDESQQSPQPTQPPQPQKEPSLDLRCGGVRLTIQRVPAWLVTAVTTAVGSGLAWWLQR